MCESYDPEKVIKHGDWRQQAVHRVPARAFKDNENKSQETSKHRGGEGARSALWILAAAWLKLCGRHYLFDTNVPRTVIKALGTSGNDCVLLRDGCFNSSGTLLLTLRFPTACPPPNRRRSLKQHVMNLEAFDQIKGREGRKQRNLRGGRGRKKSAEGGK